MNPSLPRAAVVLVLMAIALPTMAPPGLAAPDRKPAPVTRRTPHYDVRCDLGRDVADQVADYMEKFHAEFTRRMRLADLRAPGGDRFKIAVFARADDFAKEAGTEHANAGGVYSPAKRTLLIRGDRPLAAILKTLRHEGTHQFVAACIRADAPLWLNEGLAVFFADADLIAGRFELGDRPIDRVAALRRARTDNKLRPLQSILRTTHDQWIDTVGRSLGEAELLYAEAWSVVHFLVYGDAGRYLPALNKYIDLLARRQEPDEAFKAAFGTDLAAFEDRWLKYVDDMHPSDRALCARKMELLGSLVLRSLPASDWQPTFQEFIDRLARGPRGFDLADPYFGLVTTADPEKFRAFFRCPADTDAKGPDYEFLYPGAEAPAPPKPAPARPAAEADRTLARLPAIVCRHHPMGVLKLVFVSDPETKGIRSQLILEVPAGRN